MFFLLFIKAEENQIPVSGAESRDFPRKKVFWWFDLDLDLQGQRSYILFVVLIEPNNLSIGFITLM